MMPVQITDYSIYDLPPYLLQQFVGTDIATFCRIFNRQFNDFEAAAFTIINGFSIANASGNMLDVWGIRLGLSRQGLPDANYATLLQVQAYINHGVINVETLLTVIRALFDTTNVKYIPNYPAKVTVNEAGALGLFLYVNWVDNGMNQLVDNLGDILLLQELDSAEPTLLAEIMPAGVGLIINYTGV